MFIPIGTKVDSQGKEYLDLPKLHAMYNSYLEICYYKKDTLANRERLFDNTIVFIDWFKSFTSTVLRGRSYSLEQIANVLFENKPPKHDCDYISIVKAYLDAELQYLTDFKTRLKVGEIERFFNLYQEIAEATESLVLGVKKYLNKEDVGNIILTFGSRRTVSVSDIYGAAQQLFFMESVPQIEDIYLRDLKPNVVFQIRQLLEFLSRGVIGYSQIINKDGSLSKKHTQVAWKFIEKFNRNKNHRWKVIFPCSQATTIKINNWANQFVHNGEIFPSVQIFIALKWIGQLLKPPTTAVRTYDGKLSQHLVDYGDIRIENYNLLKEDFERYIQDKDKLNKPSINWLPLDQVGAYIISLGNTKPKRDFCHKIKDLFKRIQRTLKIIRPISGVL